MNTQKHGRNERDGKRGAEEVGGEGKEGIVLG